MEAWVFLLMISIAVIQIWAIVDVFRHEQSPKNMIWCLLILVFPVIAAIVYFQNKPRRKFNPFNK
ncbi:MAG TPA: PLDc N-terminal domain-containing protein [Cyclobacteriaceae bacterium]|nr:PLDc N-terminal domain-containing protein [Cyclobacteriaceae bacterium]